MLLTRNGFSNVTIVCKSTADPVRFAAEELQAYIEEVSGAKLPISCETNGPAITLEAVSDKDLTPEGYEIYLNGEKVHIHGGGPTGVLYGVYYFLEECIGLRFSGFAPDGEFVPHKATINVKDINVRRTPKLWYRGLQFAKTEGLNDYPAELAIKRIDWMAKQGMNVVLYHPFREPPPWGYSNNWFRTMLLPEIKRRGLKVECSHHNLLFWLPSEQYFNEHPEYYAFIDGKRMWNRGQLCVCTSNREALLTICKNVLQFLHENPEVNIVGVWPQDGYGMCECDECQKLDDPKKDKVRKTDGEPFSLYGEHMGKVRRYAILLNEVAKAVRKEFPEVKVSGLFYVDLIMPPDIPLEPNILPIIAIYWRCSAHPLAPNTCPINQYYWNLLERWRQAFFGDVILYEYYMGMSYYRSMPFPVAKLITREWPRLHDLGVQGATIQSTGESHEMYGLNYYSFARIAWDPSLTFDFILTRYLEGMYDGAASFIQPIWGRLIANLEGIETFGRAVKIRDTNRPQCYSPCPEEFMNLCGPQELKFFRECIARARAQSDEPGVHRQLERLVAVFDYVEKMNAAMNTLYEAEQSWKGGDLEKASTLYSDLIKMGEEMLEFEKTFEGEGLFGLSNDFDRWKSINRMVMERIKQAEKGTTT